MTVDLTVSVITCKYLHVDLKVSVITCKYLHVDLTVSVLTCKYPPGQGEGRPGGVLCWRERGQRRPLDTVR